jgi:hypothetical protein
LGYSRVGHAGLTVDLPRHSASVSCSTSTAYGLVNGSDRPIGTSLIILRVRLSLPSRPPKSFIARRTAFADWRAGACDFVRLTASSLRAAGRARRSRSELHSAK